MNKKFYKNEKFQAWFFPLLYLVLSVSVVITGVFIFNKKFYQPIVVDGKSMWPTLAGGDYTFAPDSEHPYSSNLRYHYGLADLHRSSVENLKRFDVLVTYYPDSWGTDKVNPQTGKLDKTYKIKRLWGFPGETINLSFADNTYTFTVKKGERLIYTITSQPVTSFTQTFETEYQQGGTYHYVNREVTRSVAEFKLEDKAFRVVSASRTIVEKTLEKDEYYVMGDNWSGSTDCYEKSATEPLRKKDIQGRVICINAYVTYNENTKETLRMRKIKERYNF